MSKKQRNLDGIFCVHIGDNAMSAHGFDNHRCEGSLKAMCSIRRYPARTPTYTYRDGHWHLSKRFKDLEYDCTYLEHVTRIRFCPWCGEEL